MSPEPPPSTARPPSVYRSKVDLWLLIVMLVAGSGAVAAGLGPVLSPDVPLGGKLAIGSALILLAVVLVLCLFCFRYILDDTTLTVKWGPIPWRIELAKISEMHLTRNPLSSPAASLQRIQINYDGSRVGLRISPPDRRAFMEDAAARCPALKFDGERLVRTGGVTADGGRIG